MLVRCIAYLKAASDLAHGVGGRNAAADAASRAAARRLNFATILVLYQIPTKEIEPSDAQQGPGPGLSDTYAGCDNRGLAGGSRLACSADNAARNEKAMNERFHASRALR